VKHNKFAKRVTLVSCTQEVSFPNFSWDKSYSKMFFLMVLLSLFRHIPG